MQRVEYIKGAIAVLDHRVKADKEEMKEKRGWEIVER